VRSKHSKRLLRGQAAVERGEYFDHDGLWKDLVSRFFYELLRRVLPELYAAANTKKKPKFLDKEFQDVLNTGDRRHHKRAHFADYLIEVPLKNGAVEWILFHIEIQGLGGGDLSERMNLYRCFIYAHYRREPVALALITDKRPEGEKTSYTHSHYGTRVAYEYNKCVVMELDDEELLSSDNPIDLALEAAKYALRSEGEPQKFTYLRRLTDLLAKRGWSDDDKRDLMLFIERIIDLKDEELQEVHWQYRQQLDKEGKIMYVSFMKDVEERKVFEKGLEKGIEKGKEVVAKNLLRRGMPPDIIAESVELPLTRVQSLMN
jgi:hypothetical protein